MEGLEKLAARGIVLDYIVTGRHPQIQKYLKDNNIKQFYDIWHLEKDGCVFVWGGGGKQDCMSNVDLNLHLFIFNVPFIKHYPHLNRRVKETGQDCQRQRLSSDKEMAA